MPGVQLPSRLGSLKRSKTNKGKEKQQAAASNTPDWESEDFDPQEFNPFDQPDMSITPEGRLPKASSLDPYSIVEAPLQTLTQFIDSSMKRSKTVGASSSRMRRGAEGNSAGLAHQRIRALRVEDRHSLALDGPPIRGTINRPSQRRPVSVIPEETTELSIEEQPRTLRRVSGIRTLRADQPQIVAPIPSKSKPCSGEMSARQFWVTAQEILEPRTNQPPTLSLNECLKNQLQRRTSNRSPDSGVSGVSIASRQFWNDKGKEVVLDDSPLPAETSNPEQGISTGESKQTEQDTERGRPRTRKQRSRSTSCPNKGNSSWLDSSEGRRGRPPFRRSCYEPRSERDRVSSNARFQRWHAEEIQEELYARGRFAVLLQENENLKEDLLEGHMQKILNAARHGPAPENTFGFYANPTPGIGSDDIRWIRHQIPIRIHDVRQLKYVSSIRWTPKTEATMTSARGVEVEDAGEVKVTFRERIRIKWNKWRNKGDVSDGVVPCKLGLHCPDLCRERRLRLEHGPIYGKIC